MILAVVLLPHVYRSKTRLPASFGHAQARLAQLIRGGLLGRASGGAYDEWRTALTRDGPWGTAPWGTALSMSRLARVHVCNTTARGDLAIWPLRWEVTRPPARWSRSWTPTSGSPRPGQTSACWRYWQSAARRWTA